jgi:TPR repeat protein
MIITHVNIKKLSSIFLVGLLLPIFVLSQPNRTDNKVNTTANSNNSIKQPPKTADDILSQLDDFKQSIKKAANAGDFAAMVTLAGFYETEKDYKTAFDWYSKVEKDYKDHHANDFTIAQMFGNSQNGKIDKKTNESLATYARALYKLGIFYKNGYSVTKNEKKALDLFSEASNIGNTDATTEMGILYYDGIESFLERDETKAKKYFEDAADAGNAKAMYNLAKHFVLGYYPTDWQENEAKKWYEKAAFLGNADAMYELGYHYFNDYSSNIFKRDAAIAKEWFEKAAEAGNVKAMFWLGSIYEINNNSIKANFKTAISWFEKAADLGDYNSMAELGSIYKKDHNDIKANPEKVIYWYEKAASINSSLGTLELARVYEGSSTYRDQDGVLKNYEKARYLYEKLFHDKNASNYTRGNASAAIGYMYIEGGFGLEKNIKLGKSWLDRACFLGNEDACITLRRLE